MSSLTVATVVTPDSGTPQLALEESVHESAVVHSEPSLLSTDSMPTTPAQPAVEEDVVVTDSSHDDACPRVSVGMRLSVYWDGEDEYFDGKVTKVNGAKAFVEYDDGDKEWVDLEKVPFRIVESRRKKPKMHPVDDEVDTDEWAVPTQDLPADWVATYRLPAHCHHAAEDSDTDDEELAEWSRQHFGVRPPRQTHDPWSTGFAHLWGESNIHISLSEKVKLGRRRRSGNAIPAENPTESRILNGNKKKRKQKSTGTKKISIKFKTQAEKDAEAKKKKELARPLTQAEVKAILEEDSAVSCPLAESNWVRRSMRQPSKSCLSSPKLKDLLYKLPANDPDMVVLKMKKYVNDSNAPCIVIDTVLDALEENTNCQALYIQNFNEGMRDDQLIRLIGILQRPSCNIWCLNIGETYKVKRNSWKRFALGLKRTKITHMYASEHTIVTELKEIIRTSIRKNRSKHTLHIDPHNLDVIVQCTHCWWNPINAKVLQPYLKTKGYDKWLYDAELQGLRGSTSGAQLS